MKNNFLSNNYIILLIIIILPLFFIFINHILLKVYLHHDSLLMYLNYKFIYNYFLTYNNFPQWLDYIHSGLDTSSLYLYDISKFFFPSIIIGKIFEFNSYNIYLVNLSILNSIFIYGVYKNIRNHSYSKYTLIILVLITLSSNFLFKAFSANFEIFLSFPFVFYYLKQFYLKNKFINLIKIFLIIFLVYLNSIQYFSIFYIYFIFFFISVILIFKFNFKNKIYYKKNHIILFLILLISSFIYFYLINFIISKNYYLPARADDLTITDTKIFALYGYHSILLKGLTYLSNFYWWDVPLITTNIGIFFTVLFFFSSVNIYDYKFRISILVFCIIILLLSETLIFYDIVKFLFKLPLLDHFRHFSFISIYLKPVLILTSVFGVMIYFKILKNNNLKYLLKIKIYFILVYLVMFLIFYNFTNFFNNQINLLQNGDEKIFLSKLFNDLSFFNIQDKSYLIDLFRGLKKQILISFIISISSLSIVFILILYYLKNSNNFKLIYIVLLFSLSLLPNYIYNYLNYSMDYKLNQYSLNKDEIKNLENIYSELIISDEFFRDNNSIKFCNSLKEIHPLEKLSEIIPKHAVLYENIYLFQKEKYCMPIQRWDFYIKKSNNDFFNKSKNYLHFPKNIDYLKISNEQFQINNLDTELITNINFSDNWSLDENSKKALKIENYNGKIKISIKEEVLQIPKEIKLIYFNKLTYYLPYICTFIGLSLFIIILLNIIRLFMKNISN